MSPLWGSRPHGEPDTEEDHGENEATERGRRIDEPTERSRLLPRREYLDPDDPAVRRQFLLLNFPDTIHEIHIWKCIVKKEQKKLIINRSPHTISGASGHCEASTSSS